MLIILSPAKTMDMSSISEDIPQSSPSFVDESKYLVSKMKKMSLEELKKELKISDSLATLNFERYKFFDTAVSKQALFAYNGSVFKAIKVRDFSPEQLNYAQDRVRIVSTLYGILRPLDMIRAYRISFDLNLNGIDGNLYDFWLPKLTNTLIEDAQKVGGIIINLASLDIIGAIDTELLEKKIKVITPEFKEYNEGKYETVRTYAKMARGEMTKFIIKNRIEDPQMLKEFRWKEFVFNNKISNDTNYIFTRTKK